MSRPYSPARAAAAILVAGALFTCRENQGPGWLAVLVGAGDIADCTRNGDSLTANLLDTIPGTVFVAGDNAYPSGLRLLRLLRRTRRRPHQGLLQLRPRRLARHRPEFEHCTRGRLYAGAVATVRSGGEHEELHARLPASPALQLRRAGRHHDTGPVAGSVRRRRGNRGRRARSQLPTLRPANAVRHGRSRFRDPRIRRGDGRCGLPHVGNAPAEHRGPERPDLRRPEAHAVHQWLRASSRATRTPTTPPTL